MKAPENLTKAVERLEPQVILLLDTNTLMDYPQFASQEIATSGPLLLVVPQVVDNELLGLTSNNDPAKKQKASRALKQLEGLYARGNTADGIDLGSERWLMTTTAPRPAGSIEDDQVWRYLGQVDAALLRLANACAEALPDTSALLITRDKNLTHVARSRGLAVCPWPKLRKQEILDEFLGDTGPDGVLDIDDLFSSLLDSDEERPVRIAMTLEELRSEGNYLIASGIGSLTYGEQRHPFRWTFPYRNIGRAQDIESMMEIAYAPGAMPIDNVDFMGADEGIPEQMRQFVCTVLEASAAWAQQERARGLQSPRAEVRLNLSFIMGMEWGPYIPTKHLPKQHYAELFGKSSGELEAYDIICARHNGYIQSLLDGTANNVGETYIRAFRCREELDRLLRIEPPQDNELVTATLESGLSSIIYDALDTWAVGETQEMELLYRPFVLAEEGENGEELESEDYQDYEEFEHDEDGSSELED